jgi:hypothetical protein
MIKRALASDYFTVGGTLQRDDPSYVRRNADDELFDLVMAGHFCYVLTARQMGKSSLMVRTIERVRQAGGQTVKIDLSALGVHQTTPDQWYRGISRQIAEQLQLDVNLDLWWREHDALSLVQRFGDFIEEEVLPAVPQRAVFFVDEIDSTLALDFTDDFFIAIRLLYNNRASDPAFDKLCFVLLGVAAPSDLIKDRNRTPFNIGRAIALREFNRIDAQPLERGLEARFPGKGDATLTRVFHWTDGHPYLTQKLCAELVELPAAQVDASTVDELVRRLFFNDDVPDSNLDFVREYVKSRAERAELLQMYRRVYSGAAVAEQEQSPIQNRLKLVGLVRAENRALRVRNRIYHEVFDLAWVRSLMPRNWPLLISLAALLIAVLAGGLSFWLIRQGEQQREQQRIAEISNIARLCQNGPEQAHEIFFNRRSPAQQLDIFAVGGDVHSADLLAAASCLAPLIATSGLDAQQQTTLRHAICCAVEPLGLDANELYSALLCSGGCAR